MASGTDCRDVSLNSASPPMVSLPNNPATSRNSSQAKLLLFCDLEDDMEGVYDFRRLPASEDSRPSFCLVHEQYLCQRSHNHLPSLLVDPDETRNEMTVLNGELTISPTEEPDSSEETDVGPAISIPTARPGGRVRFRSRVRIGSGLSRQRTDSFRYSGEYVDNDGQLFVGAASLSSSPSSSISAPLRSEPTNDDERRPEWGPLGQRVRLFACRSKARSAMTPAQEMEKRDRRRRKLGLPPLDPSSYPGDSRFASPNESTPLLSSPYQRRSMASWYAEHEGVQPEDTYDSDDEREASEASRLSREVDRAFGPLPGRLLNRRWWWWQIEPFVTCNCTIHDSDNEY